MLHLQELLLSGGFSVTGRGNPIVTGIAPAGLAAEDEIAIAYKQKEIEATSATVVLAELTLRRVAGKLLLFPDKSVSEAAVDLAKMFIKLGVYRDYNEPVEYTMDSFELNRWGKNCSIAASTRIDGFVTIGDNVIIGENCHIGENVSVGSDVVIGNEVVLKPGSRIGTPPFYQYGRGCFNDFAGIGTVIIGDRVSIGTNTVIQRGTFTNTVIGSDVAIGDLVVVGHDVTIGDNCLIVTQSGLAGGADLADKVRVFGQCGINERVHIGEGTTILAKAAVWKNIPAGRTVSGPYGWEHRKELQLRGKIKKMM